MVTVGSCSNISGCVTVSSVGVEEQDAARAIQIFPNPGSGVYTINVPAGGEIMVNNVIGEVVVRQTVSEGN